MLRISWSAIGRGNLGMKYVALALISICLVVHGTWSSDQAYAASETVTNGGFESGQAPWQEATLGGYQLIDPARPHAGTQSAWLCGVSNCNDQIWQTVSLPSNLTQLTLSYWVYSATQE